MTHLFEIPSNEFYQIEKGDKTFDLIFTDRPLTIGDTIIFQRLADTDVEETPDGELNDTAYSSDEIGVQITYLYAGDGLKKGWTGVGFKEKQPD
jgi:hypothetical protein